MNFLMTKNSFLTVCLLPDRHVHFERKGTLISLPKGYLLWQVWLGGQGLVAEFGDGPFAEFVKLLNRGQSLLIAKLHMG